MNMPKQIVVNAYKGIYSKSMPQRLAVIIAARGWNTRYWPNIHKTTPTGSIMQNKITFV